MTAHRRLIGGITTATHRLRVEDARGRVHHVILKAWPKASDDTIRLTRSESEVLLALAGHGIDSPELVAWSDGTETDGRPCLVMTRVPGHVWLSPDDPDDWLGQMARRLAQIHEIKVDLSHVEPWTPEESADPPTWTSRPDLWKELHRRLEEDRPEDRRFIHGDYQHFNLLWRRGRLSGVIDWTWAGLSHPDSDVGHCRLNLAVLFSPDWADRFRQAYEAESGRTQEPWWDLHAISEYSERWLQFIPIQAGRQVRVDVAGMHDRIDELLRRALN